MGLTPTAGRAKLRPVPDPIEDELAKLRERIAEQRRQANATTEPPDVEVTKHGTGVAFTILDDADD